MKLTYNKPIALAIVCLLAAPISLAGANSSYPEKTMKNVYSEQGQVGQTRDANPVPTSKPDYKVFKHSHKTDTIEVYYPQVDLPNMLTSVLVNYQLIQAPGNYMANVAPSATLSMDYTLTRQDENLISVVFRGEQEQENNTEPILTSVNYNLKTRIPITAKRLIQDTDVARQGVNRLLQQAAKTNADVVEPRVFSDQITFYLTGKYIVFYYQPSDSSAKFVELPVAIDLIRPYMTDEYRTLAVTNELNKDPRQVIADINRSLTNYKSVDGKRSAGDLSTEFTAYYNNDLVYVEETQSNGEYESSVAKYYFDGGKLIAYTKSGENLIVPSGGVARVQREEISMFYDLSLNLSEGELKVDGTASALPQSYIKDAHTAANEIRSLAANLLAATKK